jgi:hypothetical protein
LGEGAPAELDWSAWLGWTVADVQPQVERAAAANRLDTLVVALGTNDSSLASGGGDGWTSADLERFRRLVFTPPAEACVVIVLPGHGVAMDPSHAAELDQARADLAGLASLRAGMPGYGTTVVVDWQATLDARPDLVGDDGIHLVTDPITALSTADAAAARTGLYWHGVDACGDRGLSTTRPAQQARVG